MQAKLLAGAGVIAMGFASLVALDTVAMSAAVAAESSDGMTADFSPSVSLKGDKSGFSLEVADSNTTGVQFGEYFLYGLAEGWQVYDGQVLVKLTSPSPLIYTLAKDAVLSGNIRIVPPADFEGEFDGIQLARASDATNLVTDFDNGTFDFLGQAKPQLPSGSTSYSYHDPTVVANAPDMGCYGMQYGPCDGSYSIWPTANMNGPGTTSDPATSLHYNNRWADIRSVDSPMLTPSTEVISKDWDQYGGPGGMQAVNTAQVTDAQSAASGKILVVNCATKLPVPNDLVRTTISGLSPNSVYTVSGYIANLSSSRSSNVAEVKSAFFGSADGGQGELLGSSNPLPRQKSGYNSGIDMWQKTVGFIQTGPNQTSVTVGIRNFGEGGFGNDLAIDNLRVSPMSSVDLKVRVEPGSVSWNKVNDKGSALRGSEWKLTGPNGYEQNVTDTANNGRFTVKGLSAGEYTLTETKAPTGHLLDSKPRVFTLSTAKKTIDLGDVENLPNDPGMHVKKSSDPASGERVNPGQEISYSVQVKNTGNVDLKPAKVDDDLSDVLDNATFVEGSAKAKIGDADAAAPSVDTKAAKLNWRGELKVGETATLTYKVKVNANVTGKDKLVNVVVGTGDVPPGVPPVVSNCTPEDGQKPDCTTEHTPLIPPVPSTTPPLATTGSSLNGMAVVAGALVLLAAGGVVVAQGRRRKI